MTTQLQREHQLADFFTPTPTASSARSPPPPHGMCHATIEDACQTAWAILARRDDVTLDERGLSWLTTVAIREAFRLARSQRIEAPAGGFLPRSRASEPGELPEPEGHGRDVHDQVAACIQLAERPEDVRQLKPQDRLALYLKGLGYSYAEIAELSRVALSSASRLLQLTVNDMSWPRRAQARAWVIVHRPAAVHWRARWR